jgi:hypothetical protein
MSLFKTATKVAVASSVHGRVQNRQQQKWAAQQAAPVAAAPVQAAPVAAAPAPAAAPAGLDFDTKVAQLKQLGELRDAGILTPEEFEVKKAQILNS